MEVLQEPDFASSSPNGYVFLCRNATQLECLQMNLFALSERELPKMQETISDSTQIFLVNIHSGALIGVFAPVGSPGLNLEPNAFGGGFGAQVMVTQLGESIQAVKLTQKLNAGPKTPQEVEALNNLLLQGPPIDPFAVDNTDQSYSTAFPRGKAAHVKGKGKGFVMPWNPQWQMAPKGKGWGGKSQFTPRNTQQFGIASGDRGGQFELSPNVRDAMLNSELPTFALGQSDAAKFSPY